jgi:hypothetical protein
MYLRTITYPSRVQANYSALHGELSEARSAGERIREDQFGEVLKVLAGKSPWQPFITKNLAAIKNKLPKRPFRVVSRKEFEAVLGRDAGHIPGVTDKRTGVITMLEFFGGNSHATFLGAALHEAVHLVSHPPGGSRAGQSTAMGTLDEGLLEGLVECVTADILTSQGITLAEKEKRGHQRRVPVAKALVDRFGVPLLGRLLFQGDFSTFTFQMILAFSKDGWEEIKRRTKANDDPQRTIARMNELIAMQQRIRLQRFADELLPMNRWIRDLSRP